MGLNGVEWCPGRTEWWERESDKVVDTALTDLGKDPGEITTALPDAQDEAERLSKVLRAHVTTVRKK